MLQSGGVTASSKTDGSTKSNRDSGQHSLSRDDVFELLSNHRRRFALHHLQRNEANADLGELSEHVAAWENEIAVSDVSSTERKRVYTSLQQFHLPKMAEKGVVDFDERSGEVTLAPAAEDVDIYLEVVQESGLPWSLYYLGLGVVNLGLLVLVSVSAFYPLTLVPTLGWGLFVATTFVVSALVHTYLRRTEMLLGGNETPPEVEV